MEEEACGGRISLRLRKISDWKSFLIEDPTERLLEKSNPSVRYFTLFDILERLVTPTI